MLPLHVVISVLCLWPNIALAQGSFSGQRSASDSSSTAAAGLPPWGYYGPPPFITAYLSSLVAGASTRFVTLTTDVAPQSEQTSAATVTSSGSTVTSTSAIGRTTSPTTTLSSPSASTSITATSNIPSAVAATSTASASPSESAALASAASTDQSQDGSLSSSTKIAIGLGVSLGGLLLLLLGALATWIVLRTRNSSRDGSKSSGRRARRYPDDPPAELADTGVGTRPWKWIIPGRPRNTQSAQDVDHHRQDLSQPPADPVKLVELEDEKAREHEREQQRGRHGSKTDDPGTWTPSSGIGASVPPAYEQSQQEPVIDNTSLLSPVSEKTMIGSSRHPAEIGGEVPNTADGRAVIRLDSTQSSRGPSPATPMHELQGTEFPELAGWNRVSSATATTLAASPTATTLDRSNRGSGSSRTDIVSPVSR